MIGMNRIRLYSVHIDPQAKRPYETAVFVPEGFNIYAFIFTELWALYHRLWLLAFIITLLFVLIFTLGRDYGFHLMSTTILQMGIRLMIGFQANDVLRSHYEKKGYVFVDMVAAHSQLEAELRFYDRYLPRLPEAAIPITLSEA